MIDISKFASQPFLPWIILAVAGIIFLITIIAFIKRGIIKDLFGFIYIGILVCGLIFGLPLLNNLLGSLGFIPETLWKFTKAQIVSIISAVLIVVVWFILVKILNACFKKLFKYEKKVSRFFGFLLGLPFALALMLASFQCLTCPYVLKGSEQAKTTQPIVAMICEKGVEPVEDILENSGIPGSIEDIIILSRVENMQDLLYVEYKESFDNIEQFKLNPSTYVGNIQTSEDAEKSLNDFNNVIETCASFSGKVALNLLPDVETYINSLEGHTFTVGYEGSRFFTNIHSIGASEELLAKARTIFVG